jgi:hypothetical protein
VFDPDYVREDVLYYDIQTLANLTDNGAISLEIPAKQIKSNVTTCTIESSVEIMNEWGYYEAFIGNDFITLDLDPAVMTAELYIHQLDFIDYFDG